MAAKQSPLAKVEKRLADLHTQWHQAEAAYFQPDAFRLAIQSAIQTARTVSFVLQKNKAAIPNFEAWYGRWQAELGSIPLMTWMLNTRNFIEKEGDLTINSVVRAEIIGSHLENGPRYEISARLFDTPWKIIKRIPNTAYGDHLRAHGTFQIQRRWVENTLPEYELLDAVGIAFGHLCRLVGDAHKQVGLKSALSEKAAPDGRLPCMIGSEVDRSQRYYLSNGRPVDFERKGVKIREGDMEMSRKRYGQDPAKIFSPFGSSLDEQQKSLFANARTLLLRDGFHELMCFLFKERHPVGIITLRPDVHGDKYLMMRGLADEVAKTGADGLILMSETWQAPYDPAKPFARAQDSAQRQEWLTSTLAEKHLGRMKQIGARITRPNGGIALGHTVEIAGGYLASLAPIFAVWGITLPNSLGGTADGGHIELP
ncbi:MAG: hypothetical protein ABS75_05355 [Pelagibacterium sp. SCN 63-23]|nr:MAG: hypothetical protein ABS75_05355 [Pelagibacterium sp. SCN 63-23]